MDMQISHSICAEEPTERDIRTVKERHRRDIEKAMRTERGRNNRGRSMSRPHTYARENPTPYKYSTNYGISQGEKQFNDL